MYLRISFWRCWQPFNTHSIGLGCVTVQLVLVSSKQQKQIQIKSFTFDGLTVFLPNISVALQFNAIQLNSIALNWICMDILDIVYVSVTFLYSQKVYIYNICICIYVWLCICLFVYASCIYMKTKESNSIQQIYFLYVVDWLRKKLSIKIYERCSLVVVATTEANVQMKCNSYPNFTFSCSEFYSFWSKSQCVLVHGCVFIILENRNKW